MANLVYPNYVESGESKLLSQFKDKERVKAILLSALESLQSTQDSLIEYSQNSNLENGVGQTLDVIGKIVGERRSGRSDTSYRDAIFNRIVINTSEGTVNELLEILVLLSKGSIHRIFVHNPLTTAFYTNGSASNSLARTLTEASPITSDSASVYHDPDEIAFTPSELEFSSGVLIDNNGNNIVNDESRNIAISYLSALGIINSDKAILPELESYDSQTRRLVEVYR